MDLLSAIGIAEVWTYNDGGGLVVKLGYKWGPIFSSKWQKFAEICLQFYSYLANHPRPYQSLYLLIGPANIQKDERKTTGS